MRVWANIIAMSTTFSVALKYPNGIHYREYCPLTHTLIDNININNWIHMQLFSPQQSHVWTGFAVYNDQTDRLGFKCTAKGHTKGIICWNGADMCWIIHSVPEFPAQFDPSARTISDIDPNELIFGQSFVCIKFKNISNTKTMVANMFNQIYNMEPNIYIQKDAPFNSTHNLRTHPTALLELPLKKRKISPFCCCTRQNDLQISHIAKHSKHNCDIYENLVEIHGSEKCVTETWMRSPKMESSMRVTQLTCVLGSTEERNYRTTQDHSKWAIGIGGKKKWVAIGDLNRMSSQHARGGGVMVITDAGLWNAFMKIVPETD